MTIMRKSGSPLPLHDVRSDVLPVVLLFLNKCVRDDFSHLYVNFITIIVSGFVLILGPDEWVVLWHLLIEPLSAMFRERFSEAENLPGNEGVISASSRV